MATLTAKLPEKLQILFEKSRYKVLYGGRGSGKSWGIAQTLIVKGFQEPLRVLCAREIQNSIRESVHRLLSDKISELELDKFYKTTERSITGINGTEFIFEGLFRNVEKIKSLEGIDICWVEEAHNVSEDSWNLLTPTIRKEDSEIWVSFNPKYEDDPTYQRFVVNAPDNCRAVLVNYLDNPWFPDVLQKEMEQDRARDKILYEQKWLGRPVGTGGKVFPAFDKTIHIRQFDRKLIAQRGNCFIAMDPHSHYYPFITWLAVIPKNDRMNWPEDFYKHIYAEWPTFEDLGGYYYELRKKLFYKDSLADMAREIYAKDGSQYGIKVHRRFVDSRYAKGSGSWNWSTSTEGLVEQFAKSDNGGLKLECPYEKVIDAQKQVIHQDMLYNTFQPVTQYNEPTFSVDPACKNTIISLQNHRLEEDPKGDGSLEKESQKYKEPPDTIRINYAGLEDFRYQDPTGKKRKRHKGPAIKRGGNSWMR